MRIRSVSFIASAATVLGLVVGIFAAPPSQWNRNLQEWRELLLTTLAVVWPILVACLAAGLGFVLGRYVFAGAGPKQFRKNVVDEELFSRRLEEIAQANRVQQIDLLSYTAETIADILKYEFRNNEGMILRILSRSWVEEAADEAAYNERLAGSKKRRWNKSESIKRFAEAPWPYQGVRQQRFYVGMHPLLKVVLVHYDTDKILGFCSFYDWQEWPEKGGSPFKGSSSIGYVLDSNNASDQDILRRLQHQYEFVWEYGSVDVTGGRRSTYESVFVSDSKPSTPTRRTSVKIKE